MSALDFKARTQHSNLSPTKRTALLQLSKRSDIFIKPADKGGAVFIWSCPLYITKANRQLSNVRFYEHLDCDPIEENQHLVETRVNVMINAYQLLPSAKTSIVPSLKTSQFYLLPKIHKPNNPGRPIIVSAFSCLKDTNHALQIFTDFHSNGTMTGECSLYTIIPNNDGLKAFAYFLDKRPVLNPPTSTLTHLAELVLTLNAFIFNGKFYKK